MVDYPIGELVAERVRAMGVTPFYRHFVHDGVTGPNIPTVYSDRGLGMRAPVVFYNRANEASARLAPGDFDWEAIFASGVRWFHSGGIFAALSASTGELIIEAMRAAKAAGAIVSFDLNYRVKLWQAFGGRERAQAVLRRIVEPVDVLVGNKQDLQDGLGIPGPNVRGRTSLDPASFLEMIDRLAERHPRIRIVATTMREVASTSRHRWSAVAWVAGETLIAPVCELDVYERVGGGGDFAADFIYRLLSRETPEDALKLGWAHGALLTTFPGDTTMAAADQVWALDAGGSARIQR